MGCRSEEVWLSKSNELRRQCDEFIDLTNIATKIGRDPEVRAERMRKRAEAQADTE